MSRLVLLLQLVFISLTCGFPSNELFFKLSEKIVGGSKAELGQFPYQAALELNKRHQCGGTILNNRWILTAAHCALGSNPQDFIIKLGTISLSSGGDSYKLSKIIIHSDYNLKTKQNDLALLQTSTEINFTPNIQPLPLTDADLDEITDAVVSGWGYTTWPSSNTPDELQFVNVNTITNTNCALRMIFINTVTEMQICTETKGRQGVCGGDSGGPLVVNGKLVGVVSWGVPCGAGYPDVYAKVFAYRDWIEENMK